MSTANVTAAWNSISLAELFTIAAMPVNAAPEIVVGAEFVGKMIVVAAKPLPSGFVNVAFAPQQITTVPLAGTLPESQFAPSFRLPLVPPIHISASAISEYMHQISVFSAFR